MAAVQVFWFTYDGNDRPLSSLEVGELEQLVGGSIPPPPPHVLFLVFGCRFRVLEENLWFLRNPGELLCLFL